MLYCLLSGIFVRWKASLVIVVSPLVALMKQMRVGRDLGASSTVAGVAV